MSGRRLVLDDDEAHEGEEELLGRVLADQAQADAALGHQNDLELVFCGAGSARARGPILGGVLPGRGLDEVRPAALVDQNPVALLQLRENILEFIYN